MREACYYSLVLVASTSIIERECSLLERSACDWFALRDRYKFQNFLSEIQLTGPMEPMNALLDGSKAWKL